MVVVGCGGLGGYVIEILGRFGIGYLKIIDGDVFAPSNLNRQVFAFQSSIGRNKAEFTKEAMKDINEEIKVVAVAQMLGEDNAEIHLKKMDLVVDCLDNINTSLLLQDFCKKSLIFLWSMVL
ncbi:HesA/MoeB/ThiF family protein [endosymbiont 'TC1' of Trimyema compressum]|uniref:HesA/MoeB/ThiF family protein n=1 Tax=endosymbiont 'TC1' of Trimyema compressum TaxID=243899 RepID=UPI00316AE4B2